MESKLVEKSIQGDVESFETLIGTYNRYVYNIAYRMMSNEEDAKDMAQESLIKAFKSIKHFKMESSFSTWLYRIVINTCKDELRKRKHNVSSLDEPLGEQSTLSEFIEDEKRENNPILVYEQIELKNEIQHALDQLSEENKAVVVLKDLLGYSYQEIGDMLEIPIGTVRSRLSRSRLALKDKLQYKMMNQ